MADASDWRKLAANPAFLELIEWMEGRFQAPHLRAEPPSKILPNYPEVTADRAATYRVVKEMKDRVERESA